MKSLIVGMGIGQLYKSVLQTLGHEIVTVDKDISKGADFPKIEPAIFLHRRFDTVHICTPNFTHLDIAVDIAPYADIVFIEKPGVIDKDTWQSLIERFPKTRFMMVKNNMWRNSVLEIKEKSSIAKIIDIDWIRKNCIPNPGSWFTTKKLAFGGVSRDLMPHLLSWFVALNPDWGKEQVTSQRSTQSWLLKDIESTEYGIVNQDGSYDVDDVCEIRFGDKWNLNANWRSMNVERSAITLTYQDDTTEVFELGWCPEEAYLNMISDAVKNLNNDAFWKEQLEIDLWIHEKIERL